MKSKFNSWILICFILYCGADKEEKKEPVPILCKNLFLKLQKKDKAAFSGDWSLDPNTIWKIETNGQIYWSDREDSFSNVHKEGLFVFQEGNLRVLQTGLFPPEVFPPEIVNIKCSVRPRPPSSVAKPVQVLIFNTAKGYFSLRRELEATEVKTKVCYEYEMKTAHLRQCDP